MGGVYRYKKDSKGEWRWRYVAYNHEVVAVSSEGYKSKQSCIESIAIMKASFGSPVEEG